MEDYVAPLVEHPENVGDLPIDDPIQMDAEDTRRQAEGASPEPSPGTDGEGTQEAPPLQFPTLNHFVNEFLARIYERSTDGAMRWCPQWWVHDGAVFRFTALWQAWESMRLSEGPTASAKWLTYYGDPIMGQIFAPEGGPFEGCDPTRGHRSHEHHKGSALPTAPPPGSLFEPRQ